MGHWPTELVFLTITFLLSCFGIWLVWIEWVKRDGRAFDFLLRVAGLPFLTREQNAFGLGLNGLIMFMLGVVIFFGMLLEGV